MTALFRHLALVAFFLVFVADAWSAQAGFRRLTVPGLIAEGPGIPVMLLYPTQAPERTIPMGPFTIHGAPGAPPEANFKGLIVVSHGIGGTETGHLSLASALARAGYLVAALRHPGDNWQDRSLLQAGAARYFDERPRHVSRVIDALLGDPAWAARIAADARGPRVAAVGHSAGGYTVLALAGGQPDLARIRAHCEARRTEDPVFCSVRGGAPSTPGAQPATSPAPLTDPRVRAVAALAPLGVLLSAESLATIRVRTLVYEAERDRYLVPAHHARWIAQQVPGVDFRSASNAWHFAFMDAPSVEILSEDGDVRADPPGFDRPAFLLRLGQELTAFFDEALR